MLCYKTLKTRWGSQWMRVIESPSRDIVSLLYHTGVLVLFLANAMQSFLASLSTPHGRIAVLAVNGCVCAVLLLEFAVRCAFAGTFYYRAKSTGGRLRYLFGTAVNVVDMVLLACVIWLLVSVQEAAAGHASVLARVVPIMCLVHFERYIGSVSLMLGVIKDSLRELRAAFFLVGMLVVVVAVGGFLAERSAQPIDFGSLATSLYWSVITVSTIGYGDLSPESGGGRAIASVGALFGLLLIGIPGGLVATRFALYAERTSGEEAVLLRRRILTVRNLQAYWRLNGMGSMLLSECVYVVSTHE